MSVRLFAASLRKLMFAPKSYTTQCAAIVLDYDRVQKKQENLNTDRQQFYGASMFVMIRRDRSR
jgi:hypothetical protein